MLTLPLRRGFIITTSTLILLSKYCYRLRTQPLRPCLFARNSPPLRCAVCPSPSRQVGLREPDTAHVSHRPGVTRFSGTYILALVWQWYPTLTPSSNRRKERRYAGTSAESFRCPAPSLSRACGEKPYSMQCKLTTKIRAEGKADVLIHSRSSFPRLE